MALRVGGRVITGPKTKLLVLPREPEDIVFRFVAVLDDAEFLKIFPEPVPRKEKNISTGETKALTDHPQYISAWKDWNITKNQWIFLKSIEPSNIEWQTVDLTKPSTYGNWEKELRDAGLNMTEMNAIWQAFQETNILTNDMVDEARKRFLAGERQEALKESILTAEQLNTPSSEPVKDSD